MGTLGFAATVPQIDTNCMVVGKRTWYDMYIYIYMYMCMLYAYMYNIPPLAPISRLCLASSHRDAGLLGAGLPWLARAVRAGTRRRPGPQEFPQVLARNINT